MSEMSRPSLPHLDFASISKTKKPGPPGSGPPSTSENSAAWTESTHTSPHLDMIRSRSTGILHISPTVAHRFSADDLEDMGEIGHGSFGTVNKMKHRQTGTVMAVKRIRCTMDAGFLTLDEKEQKQLLMDLDVIMRSNECEFIVQFFGAIFKEGDCWICMEVMDTSLERLYKLVYERLGERLPEDIIGKVTVATVKALSYLKDNLHIIHRDVKPSNILLDRKGRIKLCDFGIAGQLVDSIAKTRDVGCKPYMAPERIDPQKARGYDVRSDVWSLGITLVEISTGQFPYPPWNSVFDQLQQVVHGDPPLLTPNRHPYFSLEFINFVNHCLIKDEGQRPKYKQLLESKFVKKYEDAIVDVHGYVTRVLEASPASSQQNSLATSSTTSPGDG